MVLAADRNSTTNRDGFTEKECVIVGSWNRLRTIVQRNEIRGCHFSASIKQNPIVLTKTTKLECSADTKNII